MSFYDLFVELCEQRGIKPSHVAQACGFNRSNITNWKNGGYTPRGVTLQKIADYFGVPAGYLLGTVEKSADDVSFSDGTGFGGGSAPGAGFGDGTGYGGPIRGAGRKTEKPADPKIDGLTEEAIKIARLFDSATEELKEAVSSVLEAGATKRRSASIKVTCPIDGTEQVIEQPYLEVGGKKFPDQNNGCEMCHPGEACEKCRLDAMLKVFHLDG